MPRSAGGRGERPLWKEARSAATRAVPRRPTDHSSRLWGCGPIGDHAMERGVAMALHFAATPAIARDGGFAVVFDRPGLGVEPNSEVLKPHLAESDWFEPTPQWEKERSWDRLWS